MGLNRTIMNNKVRTLFKYGWDEFCASNHHNFGDTCFFSVIHEATCNNERNGWRSRRMMKLSTRWSYTR